MTDTILDEHLISEPNQFFDTLSLEHHNCTKNIGFKKHDSSTPYTIEGESECVSTVSKSIELNKDVQMTEAAADNRPAHIYLRRLKEHSDFHSPEFSETTVNQPFRIVLCDSWSSLVEALKTKPKTICVNAEELNFTSCIEIVNMIKTLAKLAGIEKITISLAINKTTTIYQVKEAQKSDIFGIVPSSNDFLVDETVRGLHAQWNNIPYWPKHILDQLPGAKKSESKEKTGDIKLTPRQQQILNLIKERGASNKNIAKTLNISESTVKLHVGIVLKKFNVKNRTQLALFSK